MIEIIVAAWFTKQQMKEWATMCNYRNFRDSRASYGYHKYSSAFTIVELLIVIVVIALLAALTLVGYAGVQNQAKISAVKADLASAAKAVEVTKVKSGLDTYAASLADAAIYDSDMMYFQSASDTSYCIHKTAANQKYYISNRTGTPQNGGCGEANLVARWQLNGTATDSVGSLNGTLTSVTSATGQGGVAGTAYQFDGATSEINVPLPSSSIANVTVSAWVNVTATTKGTVFHVGTNNGGYSLGVGNMFITADRRLAILFPARRWMNSTTIMSPGWHLLALSLSADSLPSAYVDGERISGSPYTGYTPIAPTGSLVIGRNTGDDGSPATSRLFNSTIDDVRFYDAALSAAELKSIYAAGAQ